MRWSALHLGRFARRALTSGNLAGALSAGALARGGRSDAGSGIAPINAPSHWVWGDRALRQNDATLRYTLLGAVTHQLSSVFWAVLYQLLRTRRRHPTPANALVDAATVAAVAALVDFKLVPKRLTPGFEHRLSKRNLTWVYVSFAAGLALAGIWASRRP